MYKKQHQRSIVSEVIKLYSYHSISAHKATARITNFSNNTKQRHAKKLYIHIHKHYILHDQSEIESIGSVRVLPLTGKKGSDRY